MVRIPPPRWWRTTPSWRPARRAGTTRRRGTSSRSSTATCGSRRHRRRMQTVQMHHGVTAMSLRPWIQIWCEAKRANIPCPWWLDGLVSCRTYIFTTKITFSVTYIFCVYFCDYLHDYNIFLHVLMQKRCMPRWPTTHWLVLVAELACHRKLR